MATKAVHDKGKNGEKFVRSVAIAEAVEEIEKAAAKERQREGQERGRATQQERGWWKVTTIQTGKTRDKVAASADMIVAMYVIGKDWL